MMLSNTMKPPDTALEPRDSEATFVMGPRSCHGSLSTAILSKPVQEYRQCPIHVNQVPTAS